MSYIINFLKELGQFFETALDMAVNFIQQTLTFIKLCMFSNCLALVITLSSGTTFSNSFCILLNCLSIFVKSFFS